MTLDDDARAELARLEAGGRLRGRRVRRGRQGVAIEIDGREVINFSSNDYLGLAGHPALEAAAAQALRHGGVGAGASRLLVGNTEEHEALEREIAAWLELPAACLFNSGYAANTGVLPVVARAGDVVFSDELNHASLIDACRLSRAEVVVYRHLDVGDLDRRLDEHRGRRRVILSETLFSMDGDLADVRELDRLRRRHGAVLILDEAHAMGAMGDGGRGVALPAGVVPDVVIGTLGKALGAFGAFAVGSRAVVDLLWNRARPLVFSTGLPAVVVAAGRAAIGLVRGAEGDRRRHALAACARAVRGSSRFVGAAAIQPLVIGDERVTMDVAARLFAAGFLIQGIRPPTVPAGSSRLRIALSASHTIEMVRNMLSSVDDAMRHSG